MTVSGLGMDLVEIARIEDSVRRHGERFIKRVFTAAEQAYCGLQRHPAQHLAARFAAKEAGAKALGSGIRGEVGWLDVEVVREAGHAPKLLLHRGARKRAEVLGVTGVFLSLTHTETTAGAVVVLQNGASPPDI